MPLSPRPAKVSSPPTAATATVPFKATGAGSDNPVSEAVMVAVEEAPVETRLLSTSRMRTAGWVPKTWPDLEVAAEVAMSILVATPCVRSIV